MRFQRVLLASARWFGAGDAKRLAFVSCACGQRSSHPDEVRAHRARPRLAASCHRWSYDVLSEPLRRACKLKDRRVPDPGGDRDVGRCPVVAITATHAAIAILEVVVEEQHPLVAAAKKRCLLYTSPSPRDRQKSRM